MPTQAGLDAPLIYEATVQRYQTSTLNLAVVQEANEALEQCFHRCSPLNLNTSSNILRNVVEASFQLPNLDFSFQSFTVSPAISPPTSAPVQSSPLAQHILDGDVEFLPPISMDVLQVPSLSHPNSPYVPWASPIRHDIMRSSTPNSVVSRSGARAPEPPDVDSLWLPMLRKVSKSIYKIRRAMARGMIRLTKHVTPMRKRRSSLSLSSGVSPWASPEALHHLRLRARSPSTVSGDSACTNSLAIWLATRRHEAEIDLAAHRLLTLAEYDHAGSWTRLPRLDPAASRLFE